jgi:hypothetical protein
MERPSIKTAIPKRRYKLGEFVVTVLGEIETDDPRQYQYIAAVVVEGDKEPGIFLTAERNRGAEARDGSHALRLIMRDGAQVIGSSDRFGEEEQFAKAALDIVVKVLDLDDEEPYRLM